jgi:hypothetical protein
VTKEEVEQLIRDHLTIVHSDTCMDCDGKVTEIQVDLQLYQETFSRVDIPLC